MGDDFVVGEYGVDAVAVAEALLVELGFGVAAGPDAPAIVVDDVGYYQRAVVAAAADLEFDVDQADVAGCEFSLEQGEGWLQQARPDVVEFGGVELGWGAQQRRAADRGFGAVKQPVVAFDLDVRVGVDAVLPAALRPDRARAPGSRTFAQALALAAR